MRRHMEEFIVRFAENGYLAVFVLMALESACIPIPSEVTMLFGGALASAAFATVAPGAPQLNIVAVIAVGTFANLIGSYLAYWVGRVLGRAPLDKYGKYVLIRSHDIDKAERWWAKHGSAAVFWSRMLPVLRTFISLPAGIERMPLGRFTVYTVVGCVPWVTALGLTGYALGAHWDSIIRSFSLVSYAIAAVLVLAGLTYVIRRRKRAPSEV